MWMWLRPAVGIWAKVSMIGEPKLARSGANVARPVASSPMQAPSIVSSGVPRSGSGTSGMGGGVRKRTMEVTFFPDAGGPVAVGAHRGGPHLGREEQGARVDLGDRQQVEVQGGDDRAAAPAAAQRPEEVEVVAGVDGPRSPSAVTSSIARTRLQAKPWARPNQLRPPPSV